MNQLFSPLESGLIQRSRFWCETRDADLVVLELFQRHYTFGMTDSRKPRTKHFVGPGERMVLIFHTGEACFVWRKFISLDHQEGVNCAIFRNEGPVLSSELIRNADELAWQRWPGERLYTYVNQRMIRSSNPGCCFIKAGWRRCGLTKKRGFTILEIRQQVGGV